MSTLTYTQRYYQEHKEFIIARMNARIKRLKEENNPQSITEKYARRKSCRDYYNKNRECILQKRKDAYNLNKQTKPKEPKVKKIKEVKVVEEKVESYESKNERELKYSKYSFKR